MCRRYVHCGDIVELQGGTLATVTAVKLSPDAERILNVRLTKTTRNGNITTWMKYNTLLRKMNRRADCDIEVRCVEETYCQQGMFSDVPERIQRIERAVR